MGWARSDPKDSHVVLLAKSGWAVIDGPCVVQRKNPPGMRVEFGIAIRRRKDGPAGAGIVDRQGQNVE